MRANRLKEGGMDMRKYVTGSIASGMTLNAEGRRIKFERYLAKRMAKKMQAMGDRARELDWYAGNLFPEERKGV